MDIDQNIERHLQDILTEYIDNEPFPGLAIGIVKDNNVLFTGEFGTADVSKGDAVTRETLFHQASVSKTFVATAIMQLVERGQLDLDAHVTQYLTYFTLADERYRQITIRQLLNHTSGMPDEEDYAWDRPEYDEQSLERYVKAIQHLKLLSPPGEKFAYSNIGYEILGDVIAKITGMSFEQYMEAFIFEPLGMKASSFLKQEVEAQLAAPHILGASAGYGGFVSNVFPYNRAHAPSSTLYTNAADMCQYLLAHQNNGRSQTGYQLLKPSSYDEMWMPQAPTGHDKEHAHIGLGWFLGEYKGSRIFSHSGWDTGFLSNLMLLPDKKIAIIVMTNCDYVWLGSVFYPILDLLLGSSTDHIKQSIAHKVSSLAVSDGIDAAMAEYYRIKSSEEDRYYLVEFEFLRITEALTWTGYGQDAERILACAATFFPESKEILGRLKALQGT